MSGDVMNPPTSTWTPPPTWDLLDTVEVVTDAVRNAERSGGHAGAPLAKQLVQLRHAAAGLLDHTPRPDPWEGFTPAAPVPVGASGLPELPPQDLSAAALRTALGSHGCLIVRGALDAAQVTELRDGIDQAVDEMGRQQPPFQEVTGSPWFDPLVLQKAERTALHRNWVGDSGVLTCDSPRVLYLLLEAYREVGLERLVQDYLGERSILSACKCTLRRITAEHTEANWHQDGAFLGPGIRAVNVWASLSDCGEDAPGLDIVPRRFSEIVETGTVGAWFDWAVSDAVVARYAESTPVIRPVFAPGDAIIFDDMLLHRTATDPAMTGRRYSIETWAFAPSAYPEGQVPLAW